MKYNNPEQKVKNSILEWLRFQRDCFAWPNDSVGIFDPVKKTFRRKGKFHINGVADILGIWHGRPLAIEVKSSKGILSDSQRQFLESFRQSGGIAVVARSVGELEEALSLSSDPLQMR